MTTVKNTIFSICILSLISCGQDWLEKKRDIKLIIPTSLKDMRLLLTNEPTTARDAIGVSKVADGDVYLTTERYMTLSSAVEKGAYLWDRNLFSGTQSLEDWNRSYSQILLANVVLEGLSKIETDNSNDGEWNAIKGAALYLRGKAFYNLAQLFAPPYQINSQNLELGVPLRLSSDINAPVIRTSVEETYRQIISDISTAVGLLPNTVVFKTDPSKPAALGFLARVYLTMGKYDLARDAADQSLKLHDTLLDYNLILPYPTARFQFLNDEVIIHSQMSPSYYTVLISNSRPNYVVEELYNMYDANDLRKQLYFFNLADNKHSFKGTYTGSGACFTGIATDEILLIRAECFAREGNVNKSIDDINRLLTNRYISGTYTPLSATSREEAIQIVLTERRKELIGRGTRWSDLRRLNQYSDLATTLTRVIGDTEYQLLPNDARYTFPIPEYIIKISNIEQNL